MLGNKLSKSVLLIGVALAVACGGDSGSGSGGTGGTGGTAASTTGGAGGETGGSGETGGGTGHATGATAGSGGGSAGAIAIGGGGGATGGTGAGTGGTGGAAGGAGGTAGGSGGEPGTGGAVVAGGAAGAAGGPTVGGTSGQAGGGGVIEDRDGIWSGTTSQGELVQFSIVGGQVTFMSVGWSYEDEIGTADQRNFAFTLTEFGALEGSGSESPISYVMTGQLSADGGSGTLEFEWWRGDAMDAFTASWTVERVAGLPVCGNGDVELSEACDDGDVTDGDGCSSLCQFEGIWENEPNDDGRTAVGEDDFSTSAGVDPYLHQTTTVAASLAPAGDEDGFRVFSSSYYDDVTIRIETFGPDGVGTCSIDTVLYIRDRQGAVLAMDDDGGVGTCSALTYTIPATNPSTMVYAHVMDKGDDTEVGLYFLTLTYP